MKKEEDGKRTVCKDGLELELKSGRTGSVPDGGWGWIVCLAGFTTQFIVLGIQNNSGILYTALLNEFKQSKGATAWVVSIGLGMMFLFSPVTSALCERVGCRVVAFIGGLLGVLGFFLSSFTKDIYMLYLTYGVLWGIGASLMYLPTLRALPYWFNSHIGLSNGIVTAGSGFGTTAIGPLIQLAITKLGWVYTARILGGTLGACAVVSLLYRFPQQTIDEKQKPITRPTPIDFAVFKNKAFVVWCLSLSTFMLGYFVPFVHLPAYAEECGIPTSQTATLIGMMSIGSTFGRLFFGKLCDHPRVNRLYVLQIAWLCIGIGNTLSTLTKSYTGLVVYMVWFGVFDGCYIVLLGVLCADIVGVNNVASGMGIQFFFMAITSFAGPPLAGIIYDVSNSYEIAFYVAGAVSVLATCFLFLVPVLLPDDVITVNNLVDEEVHLQSETSGSTSSSKSLVKKLDQLGSRSTKNSTVEDLASFSTDNFLDRYWSMPKRVSSVGSLQYLPGPNLHRSSLLVVEKETQV